MKLTRSAAPNPARALPLALVLLAAPALAHSPIRPPVLGFELAVLVDGLERPELEHGGTIYVEALRGRDYTLRLTNPLPVRAGVALSVDGLNTIDAQRTAARDAVKWVLEPYETIVIPGWQVSGQTARRFTFTGERGSYAAKLGDPSNLGVIEAVFFRERVRPVPPRYDPQPYSGSRRDERRRWGAGAPEAPAAEREARSEASRDQAAPAPPASGNLGSAQKKAESLSDDYAATGMGGSTGHEVTRVTLDLEDTPSASIRIRYEFRDQLVKMGILPRFNPWERRERSTGFGWAPER